MFKIITIINLILLSASFCRAWNKEQYNINHTSSCNSLSKVTGTTYIGWELNKEVGGITLLNGGYFTLGTNAGLSPSTLDDHCGITFGHPFAMTSYPLIAIDGEWGLPESFFDIYAENPQKNGDSLKLSYILSDSVEFSFSLKPDDRGRTVTIVSQIKNLSSQNLSLGLGLVFDPGLGKRGDGWLQLDSKDVLNDTVLVNSFIPQQIMLKERIGQVDGMKLSINWSEPQPAKLIAANWKDVYENHGPEYSTTDLRKLYDLALKIIWKEQSVAASSHFIRKVTFQVEEPDFNGPMFMRWNLPGFLSLENNMPFPSRFTSLVEIASLISQYSNDCQLQFEFPYEMYSNTAIYNLDVPGNDFVYQKVNIQTEEIYEDRIVDLNLSLKHGNELTDSLFRRVFIPATPVSDTGLVCIIDSVITDQFPKIQFTFHAEVEATHQRIRHLSQKNIFLYENSQRIREFTFGRDTTGDVKDVDIVFVLDCSGSMGNDIRAVRNNINEFCDSLVAEGLNYMLGLVTFSTTVDDVHDFTNDVELFKGYLDGIELWGGRENSLGALVRATELSFRPHSKRTFIWLTDEDYPVSPEIDLSVENAVNQLLLYGVTVHSISEPFLQTEWCNPIVEPTGGNFYDIHGNFRDILLDISQVRTVSRYLISYHSPNIHAETNQIKLEIHYAGLGGSATAEYGHSSVLALSKAHALKCFPNPFNPAVQIQVNMAEQVAASGMIDIYNILGQRVRSYPINANGLRQIVTWNARDQYQREVSAGTYFVQLNVFSKDGQRIHHEIAKVLHLK